MSVTLNQKDVAIESQDIEKFLDEHDKSELSRIIWKIEQLKASESDPNQIHAELEGNHLVIPDREEDK